MGNTYKDSRRVNKYSEEYIKKRAKRSKRSEKMKTRHDYRGFRKDFDCSFDDNEPMESEKTDEIY